MVGRGRSAEVRGALRLGTGARHAHDRNRARAGDHRGDRREGVRRLARDAERVGAARPRPSRARSDPRRGRSVVRTARRAAVGPARSAGTPSHGRGARLRSS